MRTGNGGQKWLGKLLLLGLLGLGAAPRPAWAAIKLFFKDGSNQLVKSYEVRGDRVRYYSIERSEWEEVPASLVDLEATKRAQLEEKTTTKQQLEEAREIDKERFERAAPAGFEIVPGVRLPGDEGVFAYDGTRVIRLTQSSAEVVTDKKRAALLLALPAPVLKSQSLVVLPGARAAVRIAATQPTFYVQFADGAGARLELIPLKPHKEIRLVEKVQGGIGVGKSGETRPTLPVERTEVAPGLIKLKPASALARGEYAFGELLQQQKLNLEVWDFGIDGTPAKTGGDAPPVIRRTPRARPD